MSAAYYPSPLNARTAGLLLAGGRSLRFGSEKAVAQFQDRALMDWVIERFAPFPTFAVSAAPGSSAARRAATIGAPVLSDDPSLPRGPLNGVHAGLVWARGQGFDFLATAPCDAPLLADTLYSALLDGIGEANASVAIVGCDEHPLCTVWRTSLHAELRTLLARGEHPPVRTVLTQFGARRIPFANARGFANANTPETLATFEPPE